MRNKLAALAGSLLLALGIVAGNPAPAHAWEATACHWSGKGLNHPIFVESSVNTGSKRGFLYMNECTHQKYGWDDAQKALVEPGKVLKFWELRPTGPVLLCTWRTGGWYRMAGCGVGTIFQVTVHNA